MAFIETPRFPENIAYGAQGGPGFDTTVATTVGGQESRNANWQYPLHRWDVSQGLNDPAAYAQLQAFFLAMRGRANGWRFKDWTDYQATAAQGVVIGLTATTFQLVKRYTFGALTFDRLITKPVAGSVAMFDSAVPVAFTLDTATGIATIVSAPTAANVTWSGDFDVPMRFDTDRLEGRIVARNRDGLVHEWAAIPIVETRAIV